MANMVRPDVMEHRTGGRKTSARSRALTSEGFRNDTRVRECHWSFAGSVFGQWKGILVAYADATSPVVRLVNVPCWVVRLCIKGVVPRLLRTQRCISPTSCKPKYVSLADFGMDSFSHHLLHVMLPSKHGWNVIVHEDNKGAIQLANKPLDITISRLRSRMVGLSTNIFGVKTSERAS